MQSSRVLLKGVAKYNPKGLSKRQVGTRESGFEGLASAS